MDVTLLYLIKTLFFCIGDLRIKEMGDLEFIYIQNLDYLCKKI